MSDPVLDTRGLRCPLPVIRLEARMRKLQPGQSLIVIADDPVARLDLPHAAREAGHRCTALPSAEAQECVFRVTREHDQRNL